ncbi:hypothetical protein BGX34_005357, partial [Mortierella sp. NVP85]
MSNLHQLGSQEKQDTLVVISIVPDKQFVFESKHEAPESVLDAIRWSSNTQVNKSDSSNHNDLSDIRTAQRGIVVAETSTSDDDDFGDFGAPEAEMVGGNGDDDF